MTENTTTHHVERRELGAFHVEALSIGKHKRHPELNEDAFVVTPHTFAVIDGSAPRLPVKFRRKSSAQFATDVIKEVLGSTSPDLGGTTLVATITAKLNEEVDKIGARDIVSQTPAARPAALFTAARINGNKLVITALGDVHCRVNGTIVHDDRMASEELMVSKRVAAMKARLLRPNLSEEELVRIGRSAIEDDLKRQVENYFNNPNDPLGLGIIDGTDVPEKFIRTYEFDLAHIERLEIFSDGYYVVPLDAEIAAWEEAFFAAEAKDPLRWKKYPAVKAATPDQFSDDRTILIVKRK